MTLLLVALVSGCNEEMESLSVSGNPVVITATSGEHISSVGSRTSVGDVAGDGSLVMQWMPGDKIGVFGASTVNARFVSTHTEAANSADFTGKLQSNDIPQAAYYPYSETATDRTSIAVEIPAVQEYADVQSPARYDFKAATLEKATDGYTMRFKQMATLLRLNISLKDTDGLLADETLTSVSMTVADKALTGLYTYNLDNIDGGLQAVETAGSLTVKMTNPPTTTETLVAYAVVAPGLYKDCTADFVLTTDRHTVRFSTKLLADFEAGVFYNLPLTAEVLRNNNAEVEALPDVEEPEETANCYMITTAGEHDFKATVIGNGQKGIIPGAGFHTEDAAIDPAEAKLLWEDVSGFVSKVELRDGRVHYTTTDNVGNAVIAVYDSAGTILWSWHVWGVGDTLPQDFTYETRTVSATPLAYGSVQMMDRDLGAFPATDAERCPEAGGRDASVEARVINAMLYQWGRKDPFPNSGKYYDTDGQETNLLAAQYNILKPAADEASILYAIRNPAAFIDLYSRASVSDWLYEHNDMLWGDGRFSGRNVEGWTDVKTIYDPSPVGYRVPNYYAYTYFIPVEKNYNQLKGVMSMTNPSDGGESYPSLRDNISCVIDAVANGSTTRYLPKGVTMNRIGMSADGKKQHGYGIFMKRNADDAEGNFFAQTGQVIGGGTRDGYGISSYRWMSCGAMNNTIDCAVSQLYYFAWRTASYDTGQYSDHNKGLPSGSAGVVGTVRSQYSLQPRYGCAVRCVRDGSASQKTE